MRGVVKGKRWLLLTRLMNLDSQKRKQLNELFAPNRRVMKAYLLIQSTCGFVWGFIISSPGLVAQFRTIVNPRVQNAWTVSGGRLKPIPVKMRIRNTAEFSRRGAECQRLGSMV
jgi:hypothetical protein